MSKRALMMLMLWFGFAAGCSDTVPDDGTTIETPDNENSSGGESGDGPDYCAEFGWYGDGTCDDFCMLADPDCDESAPCGEGGCNGGVGPNPVEPDPVEPDPTEPDPTEPDPTEPDPTEPDPTELDCLDDSDPTVMRMGDTTECQLLDFGCPDGWEHFTDDCGCGCQIPAPCAADSECDEGYCEETVCGTDAACPKACFYPNCDDGSELLCDSLQPDCADGEVAAVIDNCWACADGRTCSYVVDG